MRKKAELLAPAGNYEAFLGAINAGADAVYLGGDKFGARAYADNFTTEEICRALHTAHFMGRKIYLTVNTLIKESEFSELHSYLIPFYEAGLDGVIVQDIGVLRYIRDHFRGLPLHASTQMTLTGERGAAFLKKHGVERIVPARELSLPEIQRIKQETGLEIECFIHGAMCYCYSGQCLFSSILGGRSGNRGRCAQPCRLPYRIYEGADSVADVEYPLSLKDMCTISYLPKLIEAGIDSFKIEGRMKKPEYAAGVTALYRKYIDLYFQKGNAGYHVDEKDLEKLQSLYIRSEIQNGYYEQHNGRDMITLHKPGYGGSDKMLLDQIRATYLHEPDRQPVSMKATFAEGEPACLQITGCLERRADRDSLMGQDQDDTVRRISITVCGAVVEHAQKMPLQHENIEKQLRKTGNSRITVSDCEIVIKGDVFLPVSALNELRRRGVEEYEYQYSLAQGLPAYRRTEDIPDGKDKDKEASAVSRLNEFRLTGSVKLTESVKKSQFTQKNAQTNASNRKCDVLTDIFVSGLGQLTEALRHSCRRIYLDSDLYVTQHEQVSAVMNEHGKQTYYLALPYILRARDDEYLAEIARLLSRQSSDAAMSEFPRGAAVFEQGKETAFCEKGAAAISGAKAHTGDKAVISGFLVRSWEGFAFALSMGSRYAIVPDAGMYSFNEESVRFWADYCQEYTLPYELNRKEAGRLVRYADHTGMESVMIVYGRIPMMVTANCLEKTAGHCRMAEQSAQSGGPIWLRDRYDTAFPVAVNCLHCYNIIYNSVPYSLHLQENEIARTGVFLRRYDFTTESPAVCRQILAGEPVFDGAYTTGHLKRGVE